MEINYNVTGKERKSLVDAISSIVNVPGKYKGVPTCNYEVDYITVDRNGKLSFDDRVDSTKIELLIERLAELGFEAEVALDFDEIEDKPEADKAEGLVIIMPRDMFSEDAIENLKCLIQAKGELIKKALDADSLPLVIEDERISFPWFPANLDSDETQAYANFISAICEIAIKQKRVSTRAKEIVNEKYAFRCFLLRLGFIGDEFKKQRKILLKNLDGSSAYAKKVIMRS